MRGIIRCGLIACGCVLMTGCGERPAPPPPAPTSLWTSADSDAVSRSLAENASQQEWASAFRTRTNRLPRVWIGTIQDRSGDHVDVTGLSADLRRDLEASQQITTVDTRDAADFVLTGTIARDRIAGGWRYPIDLKMQSPEGDQVWVGGIERSIAPPPQATPAGTGTTP